MSSAWGDTFWVEKFWEIIVEGTVPRGAVGPFWQDFTRASPLPLALARDVHRAPYAAHTYTLSTHVADVNPYP